MSWMLRDDNAMLGDAHPAVHGERMKLSDLIETLAGLRSTRHNYLCNYLTDSTCHIFDMQLAAEAADVIQDFVRSQLRPPRGYGNAMATLYKALAKEDGCGSDDHLPIANTIDYLEARDKFCRDYAAFLREFGF